MSSLAFTNRRQIWSNQHPLRKQRSLIEGNEYFSSYQIVNGRSTLNTNTFLERCAERSKNSYLKKQFSFDSYQKNRNSSNICLMQQRQLNYKTKVSSTNNTNRNKNNKIINNNTIDNNKSINSGKDNIEICDNVVGIISVPWSKNIDAKNSSEISGFSSSSRKKVSTRAGGQGEVKKSFRNGVGDRSRKQSKGDDKININIFLSETLKINENDEVSSSLESSSEADDNLFDNNVIDSEPKISTPQKKPTKNLPKKSVSQQPNSNLHKKTQSAATRRTQFQATRENSTFNRINPGPISASPSLTIQRRAPLVRAMSAPVRSIDENTKTILANKRKSRRRKALIGRNSSCDKTSPVADKIIDTSNCNGNDESVVENGDSKNQSKTNHKSRGRSNFGCDVVTLVSLISSEGSDSEKEETSNNTQLKDNNSPIKRPPFLRKTGKSVSFQENEQLNFHTVVKEFPHMLRRGSIAPLAARIRANRPPTAPPVSIFLSEYDQNNTKMPDRRKGCSKDDISIRKSSISGESKENNPLSNNDADNTNCPDYVQSFKERECWKLFQKMSNKGVSISYETVLRGMLTPTEFRNLQKQKDEKAAKLKEAEQSATN